MRWISGNIRPDESPVWLLVDSQGKLLGRVCRLLGAWAGYKGEHMKDSDIVVWDAKLPAIQYALEAIVRPQN